MCLNHALVGLSFVVMLRKARLPEPSILLRRTFRRPHTEVDALAPIIDASSRQGFSASSRPLKNLRRPEKRRLLKSSG